MVKKQSKPRRVATMDMETARTLEQRANDSPGPLVTEIAKAVAKKLGVEVTEEQLNTPEKVKRRSKAVAERLADRAAAIKASREVRLSPEQVEQLKKATLPEEKKPRIKYPKVGVKVVIPNKDYDGGMSLLVDWLRYAGILNRRLVANDGVDHCEVVILPPGDVGAAERAGWADRNAARIRSFGFTTEVVTLQS